MSDTPITDAITSQETDNRHFLSLMIEHARQLERKWRAALTENAAATRKVAGSWSEYYIDAVSRARTSMQDDQKDMPLALICDGVASKERGEWAEERAALLRDNNEYCEVLRVLGMDEEGSPVTEIIRLIAAERDLTLSVEAAKEVTSQLEAERDALNSRLDYSLKREYINRCPHEWYQGRCVHCDMPAKDGKPAP